MHILLGLLAAISMIGIVLWRLNAAADAAKGLAEKADEARGLFRRWSWRSRFAADPLDFASDPREAAAAMMVAVAQADGAMTERERAAIRAAFTGTLGASPGEAEELLAHARWLTKDVRDLDRCFKRLQPVLRRTCSPENIDELIACLREVAAAEGRSDPVATDAIRRLRRDLGR